MDKQEQPANHIPLHESSDSKAKIVFSVILVILSFAAMAFAGLKWRAQILEYKNNINQRDQEIAALDKEIKKLKQNDSAPSTTSESAKRSMTIKEWGVKIPLSVDIYEAFYVLNDSLSFAKLSTESMAGLDATCDPRKNGDSQSGMGRSLPTEIAYEMPIKEAYTIGKEIDGYYYYFAQPQSTCSKDAVLEKKIIDAFKTAIPLIEKSQ